MAATIENKRVELDEICRHWGVRRLELCGSATCDDFTAASDLDFLVEFSGSPSLTDYIGLRHGLKLLFGREVICWSIFGPVDGLGQCRTEVATISAGWYAAFNLAWLDYSLSRITAQSSLHENMSALEELSSKPN